MTDAPLSTDQLATPKTDAAAVYAQEDTVYTPALYESDLFVPADFARAQERALAEAFGCFEAAEIEGWSEALDNGDIDRIRDLWSRRISSARAAIERATQP